MAEPNTNGHESISPELLKLVHSLSAKAQIAKANYDAVLNEVSAQYGLANGDGVDFATGKITRAAKEETALHEVKTATG